MMAVSKHFQDGLLLEKDPEVLSDALTGSIKQVRKPLFYQFGLRSSPYSWCSSTASTER